MSEQPDHRTDWREPIDDEYEEWVWELRNERRAHPHLRADLQPLDSDDYPLRAEAVTPNKERERS